MKKDVSPFLRLSSALDDSLTQCAEINITTHTSSL